MYLVAFYLFLIRFILLDTIEFSTRYRTHHFIEQCKRKEKQRKKIIDWSEASEKWKFGCLARGMEKKMYVEFEWTFSLISYPESVELKVKCFSHSFRTRSNWNFSNFNWDDCETAYALMDEGWCWPLIDLRLSKWMPNIGSQSHLTHSTWNCTGSIWFSFKTEDVRLKTNSSECWFFGSEKSKSFTNSASNWQINDAIFDIAFD